MALSKYATGYGAIVKTMQMYIDGCKQSTTNASFFDYTGEELATACRSRLNGSIRFSFEFWVTIRLDFLRLAALGKEQITDHWILFELFALLQQLEPRAVGLTV